MIGGDSVQPYQTRYIANAEKIASLRDRSIRPGEDYPAWYARVTAAEAEIESLKKENSALLDTHLFPALDELPDAPETVLADLEAFGDRLMDWKTNLDAGIYILIHDSLLSLFRIRKDRDRIIKELYKLGMGLYYQGRAVQGLEESRSAGYHFENEMVFTEAGSYLKFFAEIEDEETKGYIIRALANIAICTVNNKKRVAVSSRILNIVRDEHYRSLAPGLPWDVYLSRTYMQMSANRSVLSKGDLNADELAAVLEACQVVFEPEKDLSNPNVRWLWPYYEMEYSCGFVNLATTLDRMERLIGGSAYDRYDVSGLYAGVQLPIYYGRLLRDNPTARSDGKRLRFLSGAYRKMMRTMLTFPTERIDDFFVYNLLLVLTDYYETEGVEPYRVIALRLMQRHAGHLYLSSLKLGEVLKVLCRSAMRRDPSFFDDLPFLPPGMGPAEKEAAVLEFAGECALFHDFGLIKMNMERISCTRKLFESEHRLYMLHTASGYDDLRARASTERFADTALGHHRWYGGSGGYPEEYERTSSPYRQITDLLAAASFLLEEYRGEIEPVAERILAEVPRRFSPAAAAAVADEAVRPELSRLLSSSPEPYYRTLYGALSEAAQAPEDPEEL